MPDQEPVDGNWSWERSIITVLEASGLGAMSNTEIAETIAARGLRTRLGANPATSVAAAVAYVINRDGDKSPLVRVGRGYVALRDGCTTIPEGEKSEDDQKIEESVIEEYEKAEETSSPTADETGLINAFGICWWRSKVLWTSAEPPLWGQQQPRSEGVNFCNQKGVYILYDGPNAVYVGRAIEQPLGKRLKDHTTDRLKGRWDRFSWFGVLRVKSDGTLDERGGGFTVENLITTMEALLIEGLLPALNRKRGDDFRAVEFLQIEDPNIQDARALRSMQEEFIKFFAQKYERLAPFQS